MRARGLDGVLLGLTWSQKVVQKVCQKVCQKVILSQKEQTGYQKLMQRVLMGFGGP